MNYPRTEGTRELYQNAKDSLSLYIQVRWDELESEYDIDDVSIEQAIKDEINAFIDDVLYS